MKKIYTMSENPSVKNDRRFVGVEDVVHYQTVAPLKHLSFDNISSIQFCVDGAQGLPASVTATRVTARLLSHDRTQVGEPSAPSYSNPDSDARNPLFDLHMGWRGNVLIPSVTVVCRIDTLEKPSLLPKCIGFAVMKLCIDINGRQPKPEALPADRVFLNAGQYLLPIVYGTVPTDGPFTEELMDSLPHIHGAYLAVRLFDPSVDVPSRPPTFDYLPYAQHPDFAKFVVDTSVAGSIVNTIPYSDPSVRKVPISEYIVDEILRGEEIGEGEKRVVLRQCLEWMVASFPPLKSKLPLIDARYMLPYENRFGVLCALDMLFQMPQKPSLLGVTKRSLGSQSIFQSKKFDNKIRYFKTYFRYLPGFLPKKHGGQNQPKEETLADLVIDDASLELNLASSEYNPVFNDDFSRTVGIELTQNACLLVVVSAVDILTSTALANQTVHVTDTQQPPHTLQYYGSQSLSNMNIHPSPTRNGRSTGNSNGFVSANEHFRRNEEEKGFKLRGLRGVYFNENHVDGNGVWWGIIPLLVESSFEKDGKGNKAGNMPIFSPMKALKATANMVHNDGGSRGSNNSVVFSSSTKRSNSMGNMNENNNNPGSLDGSESVSDTNNSNRDYISTSVVRKLKDVSQAIRREDSSSKKTLASLQRTKSNNRIALKRNNSNNNNNSQWMEVNDQDMDVMDVSPSSSVKYTQPYKNNETDPPTFSAKKGLKSTNNNNNNNNNQEESMSRVATGKSTGRSSSTSRSQQKLPPLEAAAVAQAALAAQQAAQSVHNGHWFVNAGTHQVPLFQGLPPEELFLAANPMAWVVSQLAHLPSPTEIAASTAPLPHATSLTVHQEQLLASSGRPYSSSGLWSCFGGCQQDTHATVLEPQDTKAAMTQQQEQKTQSNVRSVVANGATIAGGSTANAQPVLPNNHAQKMKPPMKHYQLQLVPGCSAFVNIVDPRLRAFSSDSVSRDPRVSIRTETIEKLLRAQLLRHMKYYQSNSNKLAGRHKPLAGRTLPKNFHPNAMPASNRAVFLAEEEEKKVRLHMQKAFQFEYRRLEQLQKVQRSYETAIPVSILAPTLMQEINHHFMEIISEND